MTARPQPTEPDGPAPAPSSAIRGRRGRPTRERTAQLSRIILGAARRLFLQKGFVGASMDAVAAEACISKGTLYARYPTKADLFTAMIEEQIGEWSDAARKHDPEMPEDLRGRLEHHVGIILDSIATPEVWDFGLMIVSERRRFPELARIYHERGAMFEAGLIAADIERWAASEGRRLADAREIALSLIEAALGWANVRGAPGANGAADRRAAAVRIVAVHMDGINAW